MQSAASSSIPTQQAKPALLSPVLTGETARPSRQDSAQSGGEGPHWSEWGLVVVTVILAVYTYKLWKATNTLAKDAKEAAAEQSKLTVASLGEMRRAADTASIGANAARMGADIARDTLHLAYRAHLHFDTWSIENFRPNSVPVVRFEILNRSHTAAELVGFRSTYDDTDAPPPEPEYLEPIKPKYGLVRPSDKAGTVVTYEFQRPISGETFQAVAEGKRAVYVWGELTYKDIFGDDHRTGFGMELWISHGPMGGWNAFPIDKPGYNYAD
jgi:hypothetical protein